MDKCICNINGHPIKDSTARAEINNIKNELETLKEGNTGGSGAVEVKKEAYINVDSAISHHNSAIPMLCLQTPYYNNTIVGGTLWDATNGGGHFTLLNAVKLESGKSISLTFSYGPGLYYIHLNNLTVTEVNGIYYWHTQYITVTDGSGNTMDMYTSNAMICSLLLHSTEA